MFSCFLNPLNVFRSAFAALAPGGYFEMQEIFFKPSAFDDSLSGTALEAWNAKLVEGARVLGGKDWHCTPKYAGWFKEAGFTEVVERQFAWPQNTWPKGKKQKQMGMTMLANAMEGTAAVSMAILTRAFGMSAQEVEEYLVPVTKDMKDRESCLFCCFELEIWSANQHGVGSIHTYYPMSAIHLICKPLLTFIATWYTAANHSHLGSNSKMKFRLASPNLPGRSLQYLESSKQAALWHFWIATSQQSACRQSLRNSIRSSYSHLEMLLSL